MQTDKAITWYGDKFCSCCGIALITNGTYHVCANGKCGAFGRMLDESMNKIENKIFKKIEKKIERKENKTEIRNYSNYYETEKE